MRDSGHAPKFFQSCKARMVRLASGSKGKDCYVRMERQNITIV